VLGVCGCVCLCVCTAATACHIAALVSAVEVLRCIQYCLVNYCSKHAAAVVAMLVRESFEAAHQWSALSRLIYECSKLNDAKVSC